MTEPDTGALASDSVGVTVPPMPAVNAGSGVVTGSAGAPPPQPADGQTVLATWAPHVLNLPDKGLVITPAGTAVDSGQVDEIQQIATANGVPLREREV